MLVPAAWCLHYLVMPWIWAPEPMHAHKDLSRPGWPYYVVIFFWAWFLLDIGTDLYPRLKIPELYQGIPHWNKIWGQYAYPSEFSLLAFASVLVLLAVALFQRRFNTQLRATAALAFVYCQYLLYGWGKIDHTYATFNLVLIAWVWPRGYTMRLMVFGIGLTYTLAGVEKLLTSGFHWLAAAPSYLRMQPTSLGLLVADYPWLAYALFGTAWLFQLLALPIIITKRWLNVWLVVGVLFHLGTFLLMGAGAILSPWYLGLLMVNLWRIRQQSSSHDSADAKDAIDVA